MTNGTETRGSAGAPTSRGEPGAEGDPHVDRAGSVDVIVIGAGVAGLACAAALGRAGLRVTVVEARDRPGGRIHTIHPPGAGLAVELGAEFVHGRAPELFALLRDAKVEIVEALESSWRSSADGLRPASWQEEATDSVFDDLDPDRTPDRPVAEFLGEWTRRHPDAAAVAASAGEFVAGFHAADPALMGERALAHEVAAVAAEGGEISHRIPAGYDRLVAHLCSLLGPNVRVRLGTAVTAIRWRPGLVTLSTAPARGDGGEAGAATPPMTASRAVITLPVSVLRAAAEDGGVRPEPMPEGHARALERLHMGQARRIVLQLSERWWMRDELRAPGVHESLATLGFLHSPDGQVPVWWTAAPLPDPVITGWMGGVRAERLAGVADEEVIGLALDSLAGALRLPRERLVESLVRAFTYDWSADPWARGAYSYAGLDGTEARRVLAGPVDDTLYWAGEATHWTGSAGTVDGALATGARAAGEVLRSLGR